MTNPVGLFLLDYSKDTQHQPDYIYELSGKTDITNIMCVFRSYSRIDRKVS